MKKVYAVAGALLLVGIVAVLALNPWGSHHTPQESAAPEQPTVSPTSTQGLGNLMASTLVTLPPQEVKPGAGTIRLNVTMPQGYKFNDEAPFTAVWQENTVAQVAADSREIRIIQPAMPLDVTAAFSEGQADLTVDLTVYWCEAVNETLCFVDRARLAVPLTVTDQGDGHTVTLDYALVPPVD
jgi:hypothetical protein